MQTSAASADATAEEIATLERARLDALIARDTEALGRLMSDDGLMLFGPNQMTKEKMLQVAANMDIRSIEQEEVMVRVFGDTSAVVTSTTAMTAPSRTDPGSLRQARHNETSVWHRSPSGWQFNTLLNILLPEE